MYRVMMVEKDRLMLSKLSAVIERTPGFTMAVRYQSKQDALGQGRMFDPNLILLDIEMPLVDGIEFGNCLQYHGTHSKIAVFRNIFVQATQTHNNTKLSSLFFNGTLHITLCGAFCHIGTLIV